MLINSCGKKDIACGNLLFQTSTSHCVLCIHLGRMGMHSALRLHHCPTMIEVMLYLKSLPRALWQLVLTQRPARSSSQVAMQWVQSVIILFGIFQLCHSINKQILCVLLSTFTKLFMSMKGKEKLTAPCMKAKEKLTAPCILIKVMIFFYHQFDSISILGMKSISNTTKGTDISSLQCQTLKMSMKKLCYHRTVSDKLWPQDET